MRIVSGEMKGRRLVTAPGLHTRPTADRVKESVFDIIQFDIEGRDVLDLFCGSGQLGLEAVSRGARCCALVDSDRAARDAAMKNIAACGCGERVKLHAADALTFLKGQRKGAFGLIFLDPPYGGALLNEALLDIVRFDILTQGGIIICESARDYKLADIAEPYRVVRRYRYGITAVTTVTRD